MTFTDKTYEANGDEDKVDQNKKSKSKSKEKQQKQSNDDVGNAIDLFESEIDEIANVFKNCLRLSEDIIDAVIVSMFGYRISVKSTEQVITKIHQILEEDSLIVNPNVSLEAKLKRVRQIYLDGSREQKIPAFEDIMAKTPYTEHQFLLNITMTISRVWKKHFKLPPILEDLANDTIEQLLKNTFEIISEKPLTFVVARSDAKQVSLGVIEHEKFKGQTISESLQFKDTIIKAIPMKIIQYENPTNPNIKKYEMEFENAENKIYKTKSLSLNEIINFLRGNRLLYKIKPAEETMNQILNAYERDGKITIKYEVDTPGFYITDGNITAVKIDTKMPTKEKIIRCVEVLDHLAAKHKKPERFATYVKWGVASAFDFAMKQLEDENYWLPILYPYGWTKCGKTTEGRLCLAIWRKHRDRLRHDIGFASIKNEAKFGAAGSYDTFPVLVNEVNLSNYNKNDETKMLLESIKHATQNETSRSRYSSDNTTIEHFPALSSWMFTGNDNPPDESALLGRIIAIPHTKEDEPTKEEKIAYDKYLYKDRNIEELGTLGDFVGSYMLEHQELIHEDWKVWTEKIVTEFYKVADRKVPEWLKLFVPETQLEDVLSNLEQSVRGFFERTINETYNRTFRTYTDYEDVKINQAANLNKFDDRLAFCLDKELISFLRKKKGKVGSGNDTDVIILRNVIEEMGRSGIYNIPDLDRLITLIPGAIHDSPKINNKTARVLRISKKKFKEFILPDMEESEDVE